MKLELKRPFSFSDRKILIQDDVLYIPNFYKDFSNFFFPSWFEIFKNNHPIIFEYCSGNGSWICQKAIEYPEKNWVAIEKKFDRVRKIWLNKKRYSLDNLFIICSEGNTFTTEYTPNESVERVYINFPDPWPKTRHAKHRLMHEDFKKQLLRILLPNGKVILTTDDERYVKNTISLMEGSTFFLEQFIENPKSFGDSYFSTLWQTMGRKIYYAEFGKR